MEEINIDEWKRKPLAVIDAEIKRLEDERDSYSKVLHLFKRSAIQNNVDALKRVKSEKIEKILQDESHIQTTVREGRRSLATFYKEIERGKKSTEPWSEGEWTTYLETVEHEKGRLSYNFNVGIMHMEEYQYQEEPLISDVLKECNDIMKEIDKVIQSIKDRSILNEDLTEQETTAGETEEETVSEEVEEETEVEEVEEETEVEEVEEEAKVEEVAEETASEEVEEEAEVEEVEEEAEVEEVEEEAEVEEVEEEAVEKNIKTLETAKNNRNQNIQQSIDAINGTIKGNMDRALLSLRSKISSTLQGYGCKPMKDFNNEDWGYFINGIKEDMDRALQDFKAEEARIIQYGIESEPDVSQAMADFQNNVDRKYREIIKPVQEQLNIFQGKTPNYLTEEKQTGMTVYGDLQTGIVSAENNGENNSLNTSVEPETIIFDAEDKIKSLSAGNENLDIIYDVPFEEVPQEKDGEVKEVPTAPRVLTAEEKLEIRQMMFDVKSTILAADEPWVDSYSKSSIEGNIGRALKILNAKKSRTTNKKDLQFIDQDIQRLESLKNEINEKFFDAQKETPSTTKAETPEKPQPEMETLQPEAETPQPEVETLQPEAETPQPEMKTSETPQPEVEVPEKPQPEVEVPEKPQPKADSPVSENGDSNEYAKTESQISESALKVAKPKKRGLFRRLIDWLFHRNKKNVKDMVMEGAAEAVANEIGLNKEDVVKEYEEVIAETPTNERDGQTNPQADSVQRDNAVQGVSDGSDSTKPKAKKQKKYTVENVVADENGVVHLEDSKLLSKLVKKNGKTTKKYNVLKQIIAKYPSTLTNLPPEVLEQLANAKTNGINALDDLKGTYLMSMINQVGAQKMDVNKLVQGMEESIKRIRGEGEMQADASESEERVS